MREKGQLFGSAFRHVSPQGPVQHSRSVRALQKELRRLDVDLASPGGLKSAVGRAEGAGSVFADAKGGDKQNDGPEYYQGAQPHGQAQKAGEKPG